MTKAYKLAGSTVRSRRNAPSIPLGSKTGQSLPPSQFDPVAYAAVVEVLG